MTDRDRPRLQDRVALVVGGAGGIGAAMAEAFVREGARVMIADLDHDAAGHVAEEIAASEVVPIDVRDDKSVTAAADSVPARRWDRTPEM
jgi:NAD(P)-dependent dehydrogenase (short-subunit alcohol dehydrogenase family)